MPDPLRLLIIGIDGADHSRVAGYMADGTMPNLSALARRGAFLLLQSIIPPVTPAAWTTIVTGRNPGKHGLYEFQRMSCGQTGYALADERRTPTMFHALNRHGLRVGLYNVPWSFPPDPYDGFVVAGMETLQLRPDMAWPPEAFKLFAELAGDDYEPWPMIAPRLKLDAAKVRRYVDLRVRVTTALLSRFPVDAYMVVFNMVDFVQHAFIAWSKVETTSGETISDPVRWTYALVDSAVGRLLDELCGPETLVCVVSDHGMTIADRVINMEKLFADRGWLVPAASSTKAALWRYGLLSWRALRRLLPDALRQRARRAVRARLAPSKADGPPPPSVNWSRTRAAPFGAHGCIRLCVVGRDPAGALPADQYQDLCREVADHLASLRFPADDSPVFETIFRRDDLFWGPALTAAPDLVAVPSGYRYWMASGRGGRGVVALLGQPEILAPLDPPTGVHRPTGIMFCAGPGVSPGTSGQARLIDVAPTLLHLLDLPIPDDMDGQPLSHIMTPAAGSRPARREDEPPLSRRQSRQLTSQERQQLEDRLRGLGYL